MFAISKEIGTFARRLLSGRPKKLPNCLLIVPPIGRTERLGKQAGDKQLVVTI